MPRFNADTHKGLHEPISFILRGKEFDVPDLTDELLERVDSRGREDVEGLQLSEVLARQLSIFTGEPPETFIGEREDGTPPATIREMSGVLQWLMETIQDPRSTSKAKNAQGR